jgi:integrase
MPRPKSFAELVEAAPFATHGQQSIPDPSLPGFRVVVGKRVKTWTVQVDVKTLSGPKTHKESVGRVGEKSYKDARAAAMELMGQLRGGKRAPGQPDPGPTLGEAWKLYRERHLERNNKSPRTIEQYVDCLERTLADWLDTPLRELADNPEAVAQRHARIGEKREKDGTGGTYQANHCMRCVRAVYNFARRSHKQLPAEGPCSAVVFYPEEPRESALDGKALRRWFDTWATLKNPVRRELHLLTLLTGSRREALCAARWSDVRPARRVLHQPKPKGGSKKAFDIPMSRAIVQSLRRLRDHNKIAFDGNPYLFPSATSKSGRVSEVKENDLADFPTGHALRHTWITQATICGISEFYQRVMTNHRKKTDVHQGYMSPAAFGRELRKAQEKLSRHLIGHASADAATLIRRGAGAAARSQPARSINV